MLCTWQSKVDFHVGTASVQSIHRRQFLKQRVLNEYHSYNAALAFMLLGVKVDDSICTHGPPVFQIQGELRHLSGSFLHEESKCPSYCQLYAYDPNMAYRHCITQNDNLLLNTMQVLQQVMWDYNTYTPIY